MVITMMKDKRVEGFSLMNLKISTAGERGHSSVANMEGEMETTPRSLSVLLKEGEGRLDNANFTKVA